MSGDDWLDMVARASWRDITRRPLDASQRDAVPSTDMNNAGHLARPEETEA